MLEIFDTQTAGLARTAASRWPCGGHARPRTVTDLGGGSWTPGPAGTGAPAAGRMHVVLAARLLPRRGYTASLISQALAGAAAG